jgi:hypothetical protein
MEGKLSQENLNVEAVDSEPEVDEQMGAYIEELLNN